jgi:(1->4)-alpha-D-glucan 1-alpha-D-glucosylmutase
VVSFVRDRLLVIVPRLLIGLGADWSDTTIELPSGRWKNLLTGEEHEGGSPVAMSHMLQSFPVAVLAGERG